jgi:hypothetical protein
MSTIVTFQPALAKAPPISPAPMTFHFALGMYLSAPKTQAVFESRASTSSTFAAVQPNLSESEKTAIHMAVGCLLMRALQNQFSRNYFVFSVLRWRTCAS